MLTCVYVLLPTQLFSGNKSFVIVITSFNNARWYKQNIMSALTQKYDKFRILYYDDNSPDGTGTLVEQFIRHVDVHKRVQLIKNTKWMSQMYNHWHAVQQCNDDEIVVHLDGDDMLAHNNVLSFLDHIYSSEDVWLTYGQCLMTPMNRIGPSRPIPAGAIQHNSFRKHTWMYGHLRTFYAWLFKHICVEDLKINGSFEKTQRSPDVLFMLPMLEMAGKHVRFIPKVLYIWNQKNPLSQHKINLKQVLELIKYVKKLPPYQPLPDKPLHNE